MTDYVNWWPAVVFGWPFILLAIVLSVLGIRLRSIFFTLVPKSTVKV